MDIEHDEEQAAFAASFTQASSIGAPEQDDSPAAASTQATETPGPEQTDEASGDTPKAAVPVNPLDALPPEVRALIERVPRLEAELADAKATAGRVSSLQRELDKLKKSAAAAPPPEPPKFAALDAIRSDLPEVAAAIEEVATRLAPKEQPKPAEPEEVFDQAAADIESAIAKLSAVRPSWQADKGSAAFQGWLGQQPAAYQDELNATTDPVMFLGALAKWDLWTAQQTATRAAPASTVAQRRAAAILPKGGETSARPSPVDEEEAAFEAAFTDKRHR